MAIFQQNMSILLLSYVDFAFIFVDIALIYVDIALTYVDFDPIYFDCSLTFISIFI